MTAATDANSEQSPTEIMRDDEVGLDVLGPTGVVERMAEDAASALAAFQKATPVIGSVAEDAAAALRDGGRIIFCGAGTSGRLGVLEAAECPPTFSSDPASVIGVMAGGPEAVLQSVEAAEDDPEKGARAMADLAVSQRDLVVGVAASGHTPYVRGALTHAQLAGAATALVTSNPCVLREDPPPAARVVVLDTGPEVLAGSTRLKAGTAAKLTLNAITTAAFAATGKVYGSLMVDLQVTNAKLRERAVRIVQRLCKLNREDASAALHRAGDRVKETVVMSRCRCDLEEAKVRLTNADGFLHRALYEVES